MVLVLFCVDTSPHKKIESSVEPLSSVEPGDTEEEGFSFGCLPCQLHQPSRRLARRALHATLVRAVRGKQRSEIVAKANSKYVENREKQQQQAVSLRDLSSKLNVRLQHRYGQFVLFLISLRSNHTLIKCVLGLSRK